MQFMYAAGRASHHSFRDDDSPPVGPSAIAINGHTHDRVCMEIITLYTYLTLTCRHLKRAL
jgi:hypothetical protein